MQVYPEFIEGHSCGATILFSFFYFTQRRKELKEPTTNSLQLLAGFINDHIRFEERKLFAYAEEMLTPEQLNEIHKDLPQDQHCDTDPIAIGWKDELWEKNKMQAL